MLHGGALDNIYAVTLFAAAVTALTNLNTAYHSQVLILDYKDHVLANSDKEVLVEFTYEETSSMNKIFLRFSFEMFDQQYLLRLFLPIHYEYEQCFLPHILKETNLV